MSEGPKIVAVPGIAALSSIAARQISAGQVLVDPSSVVKELIDNALDARAKSIFVDITANTIDSIQVKDDGHGIPAQDRPLACRRSCTSKIRDFRDLKGVGGKWLGFRGEALSSMAEMSSSLCITTRVEGEPVAVKLKYGRDGELASVEHDSHPIGTTVKVTKFLDFIPVRKQTASKNSANLLAKIRRLMQAYALARPTTRFRLRVLKANNNNGDFVYAPKADGNVEDATLKVIGKNCALQCDWTVLEADGFEVHAFLPKPGATGPKIAHQGTFISIDARPVSSSRGTMKQIVAAYKHRLRKSNPSLAGIKDPFFCLNIICPPDSYDPNIEPAKDDVMFDNSNVVIGVVDKLLKAYYPEASQEARDAEPPTSAQQHDRSVIEMLKKSSTSTLYYTPKILLKDRNLTQSHPTKPRARHFVPDVARIDALERTKSSRLPLERIPKGFNIQDLILPLPMNIRTVLQHCHKLDMRRNSLEWGYPAEGVYDNFAEPVLKQKILEWVTKLDALLCKRYERIGGADTRREIQEGIQRVLDTRKELGDAIPRVVSVGQDTVDDAVRVSDEHVFPGDGKVTSSIVRQQAVEPERKADDEFDFDMEQYIDLTADNERQITETASEGSIEVAKSEYDEDVEDEMLMDL
ncbi:unnamed protein product [Alternaria alternata]